MRSLTWILRREVEETSFFAKNTAQIGNYLQGSTTARVAAFAGAELGYLESKCKVQVPQSDGSSKPLLSNPTALSNFAGEFQNAKNLWFYEPYEWIENLEFLDTRALSNSYFLFRRYSNKLNQLRFLMRFGDDVLRQHIQGQLSAFDDRVAGRSLEAEGSSVIYDRPHSEGGNGIVQWQSRRDVSTFDPIRRADFCNYRFGVSQMGFVFADTVITGQPARVWNGAFGNPFGSSCTYYDQNILDLPGLMTVLRLTKSVGATLCKLGYRGAFGCDYLVDDDTSSVFLGEANLRYTGDVALFCSGDGSASTWANVLHPHSLHILAFLGNARDLGLPTNGEDYLSFESQGGSTNRAFFDPGAPQPDASGQWRFIQKSDQAPAPPTEYLLHPATLEPLADLVARRASPD